MKTRLIVLLVLLTGLPALAQTAISVDIDKAQLTWSWVKGTGGDVAEFRIKCGQASQSYTKVTTLPDPTVRSLAVRTAIAGPGAWFCVVTAANQFGESAPTNEVAFQAGTPPATPTGLQIMVQ